MMTQTVEQALIDAKPYTDGRAYVLVRLRPQAIMLAASVIAELSEPFCALVVDKDELTLLIPADALASFAQRLRDHAVSETSYRLITLDVALDPSLVGFLARISRALADAGVSIVAFGAYSRDHLLVPVSQFDKAWATVKTLTGAK
jgi:hypothetical protein